ncbi:MAG: reverse transcriptase domain-containing protein [Candidatus Thiodiazotropha sp.]
MLRASSFILDVILSGYKLPFTNFPTPVFLRNNFSALKHKSFVDRAIIELLQNSCIHEVSTPPFCVNPLTVSVNSSGKERLILDLRHVNQFIEPLKVKFEGHKEALAYARKGNLMFKFDLKSGYHHVSINQSYTKFLGFSWIIDGKRRFYVFLVLPFGISSACHLFTKLLRPLVKHWRAKGFSIVVYLDDGWGTESSTNCVNTARIVYSDLVSAGFVVNQDKSIWTPCSVLEWLGYIWNLKDGNISLPDRRISSLNSSIHLVLKNKSNVSARQVAQVTGRIISMTFVLGNICQIMSRHLYSCIRNRLHWDSKFPLSDLACDELHFWSKHMISLPSRVLSPLWRVPERIMFSDASNFAGAGVLLHSQNIVSHAMFDEFDKMQSSTYRELKALYLALVSFRAFLSGKLVKAYSDNQNVVRITSKGSTVKLLQSVARAIFDICFTNNIILEVSWIPRHMNQVSDFYSREFDFDDWGVSDLVFEFFSRKWGPFSIDRFADHKNTKLQVFNSKYWCPGTSGVDAFSFDWHSEFNWLVPPVCLIPRVLKHLLNCRARAVLVVPKWESSLFWPMIINQSGKFRSYIQDVVQYSRPSNFFVPGSDSNSIFAITPFVSDVLVMRIDGTLF